MVSKSISEIRAAVASARTASSFAVGFANAYFSQAFGVLVNSPILRRFRR
jgi:hypothetical protein